MSVSQKPVRVRIRVDVKKPKRKSRAWINGLWSSGSYSTTRRKEEGLEIVLDTFHRYQLEFGPDIFGGLNFKLIPCER